MLPKRIDYILARGPLVKQYAKVLFIRNLLAVVFQQKGFDGGHIAVAAGEGAHAGVGVVGVEADEKGVEGHGLVFDGF